MNESKLSDFPGGWLVGSFSPALFSRGDIEVGVKTLKAGFVDGAHYHKKSNEYNLLLRGSLSQNGVVIEEGSIFVFGPCEVSKVSALTDALILVIRDGSGIGDKYLVEE
jgi:hypothetical protein